MACHSTFSPLLSVSLATTKRCSSKRVFCAVNMSNSPPFIKFFPKDYLGDTSGLTIEEHGAYLLLLFLLWENNAIIKFDPKRLSISLGISRSKFLKIWPNICHFFCEKDGDIFNRKLRRIYMETIAEIEKNKANGKLGAERRWGKDKPVVIDGVGIRGAIS